MISNYTYQLLTELNYGWVAAVLIGLFGLLYFSLSIGLHLFFNWTLKRGWTKKVVDLELFKNQIRFELLHSLYSILIFGLYGLLIVYCFRNGIVGVSFQNDAQVLLDLLILILWNELHFYLLHKLMHTRLFSRFHSVHHKSVVVTPFSTYSFHPLESLIMGSVMILPMLVYTFEIYALIIFPIYHLFFNTLGHSNVQLIKYRGGLKRIEISTQHNDHHTTYNSNFGFVSPLMDVLMRTYYRTKKK